MTFVDFVLSGRYCSDFGGPLDCCQSEPEALATTARVYADDLVIEYDTRALDGRWSLTIGNWQQVGRLIDLERALFMWATREGVL